MILRSASKPHRHFSSKFGIPSEILDILDSEESKPPEENTLKDSKGNKSSKKEFKPLIVCGSLCGGKSTLIDHFKFNKPQYFRHVLSYTTRSEFFKEEAEFVDYIVPKMGEAFFHSDEGEGGLPRWLFKHQIKTPALPSMY
jgi:hypothetical protein